MSATLASLRIRNLALVEDLLWEPPGGFVAVTGETGAGKSIILGALGYFIFPIDAIPDVLVPLGYTDDLGVLAAAVTAVAMHITPEVKQQATDKLAAWFG